MEERMTATESYELTRADTNPDHPIPDSAMPPFANAFRPSHEIVKDIEEQWLWVLMITKRIDEDDLQEWIENEVRDCFKRRYLDSWSITKTLYISDHSVERYLRLLISSEKLDQTLHNVPYVLTAIVYLDYFAHSLPIMLSAEVRSRCMFYGDSFPSWKGSIDSGQTVYLQETEPEYLEWIFRTTSPREAVDHMRRIEHHLTNRPTETEFVSLLKAIANGVANKEITYDSISAGASLVDRVLGLRFQPNVNIVIHAMQSMFSFDQTVFAILISWSSTNLTITSRSRSTRLTKTKWWSMAVRHFRHTLHAGHRAKTVHLVCMARVFNKIDNVTERYQAITEFCASLPGDLIEWWQVYFSGVDQNELGIAKSALGARYRQLCDEQRMGRAGIDLRWYYKMLVALPRHRC